MHHLYIYGFIQMSIELHPRSIYLTTHKMKSEETEMRKDLTSLETVKELSSGDECQRDNSLFGVLHSGILRRARILGNAFVCAQLNTFKD